MMSLRSGVALACLANALVMGGSSACAQTATAGEAPVKAADRPGSARVPEMRGDAEIIVTGSRLRGTPLDSALPVDVVTANDMHLSGQTDIHEVIKALPYNSGYSVGTNNVTQAPRSEGTSNIMLRALGGTDILTLTLFNGHRVAQIERGIRPMVDVSGLPMSAVGRIEILKDGGAATYGSDAVAGVVNFITYKSFEGFDVGIDHSFIRGGDGDYNGHITWGKSNHQGSNILLSAAIQHTGGLAATARSFTNKSFVDNPNSWATSNPATYLLNNGSGRTPGTSFVDPNCTALGGVLVTTTGRTVTPACETQVTQFQNLVDETTRYQFYGEVNHDFGGIDFHLDAFYNLTDVPHVAGVPSPLAVGVAPSSATTGAGAGVQAGNYFIPSSNPGLVALLGANCANAGSLGLTAAQCAFAATNGVLAPIQANYRVYGLGGNLANGGGPDLNSRRYDEARVSATLQGSLPILSTKWAANVTYGWTVSRSTADGNIAQRLQLALRGFGGANCNTSSASNAGSAAAGCYYWNPFSNAVAANAVTNVANPGYVASVANSADVARWMTAKNQTVGHDTLLTSSLDLNGLGFKLPGGVVKWALGVEYRRQTSRYQPDDIANLTINPCSDPGVTTCAPNVVGSLADQNAGYPLSWRANTYAVYGELGLPFTSKLNAQLALRYENGPAGGTTNPKIAAKWQIVPWLALRGSYESTFRAPASWQTDPGSVLPSLLFGQGNQGSNLVFNVYGNSALKPETAKNYDIGIIFTPTRNLSIRVDAWQYDFRNQISQMNGNTLVATMFPKTNGVASNSNCGNSSFAGLQSQFLFNSSGCGYANIQSVQGLIINQSPILTNGLDFVVDFSHRFGKVAFRSSLNATYLHLFRNDAIYTAGVQTLGAYDSAGFYNFNAGGAMPRWKLQWSNNLNFGRNNLRLDMRYSSSIIDQRCNSTTTGLVNPAGQDICAANYVAAGVTSNTGYRISSSFFADLTYNFRINDKSDATLSVANVLNSNPPFARTDLSYNAFVDNGLGRVFKLALHSRF